MRLTLSKAKHFLPLALYRSACLQRLGPLFFSDVDRKTIGPVSRFIELQVLFFVYQWSRGLLPPVSVNISNLLILFILTQRGNRVKEIFM